MKPVGVYPYNILKIEELEKKADEFAINQMIDKKVWQETLNNYDKKEEICKKKFSSTLFFI